MPFEERVGAIDPDAFGFLPPEDTVTEIPALETEVSSEDSLVERLEAAASGDGKTRIENLFLKAPWYTQLADWILSRRGLGCLTSLLFHLLILICLAAWMISVRSGSHGEPLQAGFSDADELSLEGDFGDELDAAELEISDAELVDEKQEFLPNQAVSEFSYEGTPAELPKTDLGSLDQSLTDIGGVDLRSTASGKATSGRNAEARRRGLPGREGDTTDESEAAVEAGLAWLAAHQLPDGGWSFDLTEPDEQGNPGECQGLCSNSFATSGAGRARNGLYPSRMAATGIALLAFLGAGYDHKTPNFYRDTVERGLRYIKYHARQTASGIDFREEGEGYGMYTQAIAVVTVCEAYELTDDPELESLAKDGAALIVKSQHDDGGWRYQAAVDYNYFSHTPSDTSVSGWQMLALKSAMSAGVEIPTDVFYKAGFFLDTVQSGVFYRYTAGSNQGESQVWGTTAVGILMREYLGWDPKRKEMKRGAKQLASWFNEQNGNWKVLKRNHIPPYSDDVNFDYDDLVRNGRLRCNLYFAYYAAIALHHHGGATWHKAFAGTRQMLIETQNKGDLRLHEKGSWLFYDRYLNDGGRLLNTAIAVLILETPYRYLPMYK